MNIRSFYIIIFFLFSSVLSLRGQPDLEPPVSPVLELVTVDQLSGFTRISWTASPSPDATGYVIYEYINNEGYPLDTINDILITNYTHNNLKSSELSVSYVVAAFDGAGNISTLSNFLNTVFLTATLDTCNKTIELEWNNYPSYPREVESYTILFSENGSTFREAGTASAGSDSFSVPDFNLNSEYCFCIRTDLPGNDDSFSNKTCLETKMQNPPQWINADYATVTTENDILLSFSIDPGSEINKFVLERRKMTEDAFSLLQYFTGITESLSYTDTDADISEINYYRLSAINNCDVGITVSNISSNIVLSLESTDNELYFNWNPYAEWIGSVNTYTILINEGGGIYDERYSISPHDTSFTITYSDLMYDVTGSELCFLIRANEGFNPYGSNGESFSRVVCIPARERITVPNLFTPDGDLVNDLFSPVLSFTPVNYHLLITDMRRKVVFETRDPMEKWDGTRNGVPVAEGVFLWMLDVIKPSGKTSGMTGTVTVHRSKK